MSFVPMVFELRDCLGSWEKVAEALGYSTRQPSRIQVPGYGAGRICPIARREVERLLEAYRPFPLGDLYRKSREWLVAEKSRPGSDDLRRCLEILDGYLAQLRPADETQEMEHHYMCMMVAVSKALHHGRKSGWFGDCTAAHLVCAQEHAEAGLRLAEASRAKKCNEDRVARLQAIFFVNWIMLILEQSKLGEKNLFSVKLKLEHGKQILRAENALVRLKCFVSEFPFLWQAVYNGLEVASTLNADADAIWFYTRLKSLDPGFQDFDYSPGEVLSISREEGMKYFHDKYRQKFHTPNKGTGK